MSATASSVAPKTAASPLLEDVHGRLAKVLGPEKARACVQETLAAVGLADIATPDELLRFASQLVQVGGFVGIVGRSLKVQAMLRGAVEGAR